MLIKENIPVANIYYMLTYIYRPLKHKGFKRVNAEKYDRLFDLAASLLISFLHNQIKAGLKMDYVSVKEPMTMLRGKICFNDSIRENSLKKHKYYCEHDVFTENFYMNQILKTTAFLLLRNNIGADLKKELKKLMLYFSNVDLLDSRNINWNFQYTKNNQSYKVMLNICYWVINKILPIDTNGNKEFVDIKFSDQDFEDLFEHFVLNYYKEKFKNTKVKVNADQIWWRNDFGIALDEFGLLPKMQTDITITSDDKILVIDTKTNKNILETNFRTEKKKIRPSHINQITTYVNNKVIDSENKNKNVSGMLLYAQNFSDDLPSDLEFNLLNQNIKIASVNLNCESFSEIDSQLDNFVKVFL